MTQTAFWQRPAVFWGLVALLALAGTILRVSDADHVATPDGIALSDIDTARRLARLNALDASETYPVVETHDGAPDGTTIHWTLPMDWCIRALDPIASTFYPRAKPYEAGACLAGPVLAALSLILFAWGMRRWLGAGAALVAAAFYAFSYSTVNVSWFGNGDHQNLQHLMLLVALFPFLHAVHGLRSTRSAITSGAALGFAIWISTESQLLFLVFAITLGTVLLVRREERDALIAWSIPWTLGLLAMILLGTAIEQESMAAFEWDQVSWFQAYPVVVFGVFLVLARVLPAKFAVIGGEILAIALGLIVLLAVPSLGAAFEREMATFDVVNRWLQVQVSEYRPALETGAGWSIAPLLDRFSYLILALPVLLITAAFCRGTSVTARITVIAFALGAFSLALWEVKLGHLFAMIWPIAIPLGARGLHDRLRPDTTISTTAGTVTFAVVLLAAVLSLPSARSSDARNVAVDRATLELADSLRNLQSQKPGTVLAPWSLGGMLMYYADAPVVATGYHRNLAGIHDHLKAFTARPDAPSLRELLTERQVRYVVVWYDRRWLWEAPQVLGTDDEFARMPDGNLEFLPRAQETLYWRLRYGKVSGFREVARSAMSIQMGAGPEPIFRVFEWTNG